MRTLNRIEPRVGPEHFTTYQLLAPIRTHRRRATCSEVDCEKKRRGYRARFDVSTLAGRENAMIVERSGRRRTFVVEGPMVTYTFPAGQDCFDVHTVPLEREPLYVVRGGDHRGNPRQVGKRVHKDGRFWVEEFAENQQRVAERVARG